MTHRDSNTKRFGETVLTIEMSTQIRLTETNVDWFYAYARWIYLAIAHLLSYYLVVFFLISNHGLSYNLNDWNQFSKYISATQASLLHIQTGKMFYASLVSFGFVPWKNLQWEWEYSNKHLASRQIGFKHAYPCFSVYNKLTHWTAVSVTLAPNAYTNTLQQYIIYSWKACASFSRYTESINVWINRSLNYKYTCNDWIELLFGCGAHCEYWMLNKTVELFNLACFAS